MSKHKDTILAVLKSTSVHPSADWIYERVRKEIPSISMGTIYRNLRLLEQDGIICMVAIVGSQARYDGNPCNHYHFICNKCNGIIDLDEPVNKTIQYRVAQKTGFIVKRHCLQLWGICRNCQ